MEESKDKKKSYTGKLQLKKTFNAGQIKQSFSHGRTRSVSVEVKKKRTLSNFNQQENLLKEEIVKRPEADSNVDLADEIREKKSETCRRLR